MNEPHTDGRGTFVISCKAPRSLTEAVEKAVREHPVAFPDKSTFVRKSLTRMLRDIGYINMSKVRRLAVDETVHSSPTDDLISSVLPVDGEK